MSKKRRDELHEQEKREVMRYYYACPRCESTATSWIGKIKDPIYVDSPYIHKWVCQECCHVFELMDPKDVRKRTGWVD